MDLEPIDFARKILRDVRKNGLILFADNAIGDLEREAFYEGFQLWLEASRGWIYVAKNATFPGLHKVGCTRINPYSRMGSLNRVGMVTPWVLEYCWPVYDAYGLEAMVHRKLSAFREGSELFRVPLANIKQAVDFVIHEDSAKLSKGLQMSMSHLNIKQTLADAIPSENILVST